MLSKGDVDSIRALRPTDATTNPSLILAAAKDPKFQHLIQNAVDYANSRDTKCPYKKVSIAMDRVAVNFGEIGRAHV